MRRPSLRGSTRRLANKLSQSTAPLSCEALEERRMLSAIEIIESPVPEMPFLGLRIEDFDIPGYEADSTDGDVFAQPDHLTITFSNPVLTTGGASGAHSVTNPANWLLIRDNVDVSHLIVSVQVDGAKATLNLAGPLSPGRYQVGANDNIQDQTGLSSLRDDFPGSQDAWRSTPFNIRPLIETGSAAFISIDNGNLEAIDADAAGHYVVVYTIWSQGTQDAYAQRFSSAGERLGDAILVASGQSIGSFDLDVNASGRFIVSWRSSSEPAKPMVSARIFAPDGTPASQEIRFEVGATKSDTALEVALSEAGEAVVVWTTLDANRREGVWMQRLAASGALVNGQRLVGFGQSGDVAISPTGEFVIAWRNSWEDDPGVFIQRYDRLGKSRGGPITLAAGLGIYISPQVAMDATGGFAVLYQSVATEDDRNRLQVQRFTSAGNMLPAIEVKAEKWDGSYGIGSARLSMDRSGRMIVQWQGSTLPSGGWPSYRAPEYAQLLDANGDPVAPRFKFSGRLALADNGTVIAANLQDSSLPWGDRFPSPSVVVDFRRIELRQFFMPQFPVIDLNGDAAGLDYRTNFVPGGAPVPTGDAAQLFIRGAKNDTLIAATVSILQGVSGDLISLSVTKPGISASFSQGVLTLSGAASVADYEAVLRGLKFSATATRPVGSTVEIRIVVNDGTGVSEAVLSKISIHVPGRSTVVGRHVFYNNSGFDGNDPAANAADDAAIATDKTALLPDQAATFANYTSYTRGINGVIIDLAGPHGTITADDFIARIGHGNDPSQWKYLPQPLVVVRAGAGVGGSDRIELIWADNTIRNTWLQVVMLDNGDTGLATPDVFMFGNRIGESGDEPGAARLGVHDMMRLVNLLLAGGDRAAAVDSPIDYNRDGQLTVEDLMAALNQMLSYSVVEWELIEVASESASDGLDFRIATNMLYQPLPLIVARPLRPEDLVAIHGRLWQSEEEELDLLAQQPAVQAQLMLAPGD